MSSLAFVSRLLIEACESFDGQPSVADDSTHRESADWIVPRNGDDTFAIRHDGMLALSNDAEPGLLQSTNGMEIVDASDLPPPTLAGDLDLSDVDSAR